MNISEVLIGADPELFLAKGKEVISAEGLIGGTKDEPKMITEEGHAIQEDNIMVEFNIPASDSVESFRDNINLVLSYLDGVASLHGAKLHYSASEILDKKYLQTEQAKMFGCEPDYNVYLKCPNDAPSSTTNLRTCGGHIHVGYNNPDLATTENIVKAMDLFLGVPSILMDADDRRKEMYGKAGAFRFKDYGVEYRTLSNFWIYTDELKEWAYNSTINALNFIQDKKNIANLENVEKKVIACINNNDKQLAKTLLEQFQDVIVLNQNIKETA